MNTQMLKLMWLKPTKFADLDSSTDVAKLREEAHAGLYVWLLNKEVIYAGQSQKDIFGRQIDHAALHVTGRYVVYDKSKVQDLYSSYLSWPGNHTRANGPKRLSHFGRFLWDNSGANGPVYFPSTLDSINAAISLAAPNPNDDSLFTPERRAENLKEIQVAFGVLGKSSELEKIDIRRNLLDSAETEIILRFRNWYWQTLASTNAPPTTNQLISKTGWIAHTSTRFQGGVLSEDSIEGLEASLKCATDSFGGFSAKSKIP